jgi:hypothetical protein
MAARAIAALALACLVAGTLPVLANHLQTDSGRSLSFDHKTGNEWWVEVTIGGADAARVSRVEVEQETQRGWLPLAKRSWGAWAASYHFEPWDPAVRFRATFGDGVQAVSCWFTHPAGAERCGVTPPTGAWTVQAVGGAGAVGVAGSLVQDIDRDGRAEVYVLGSDGLVQHRKDAAGWHAARVLGPQPGIAWTEALALTAGDADDDGRTDLYSAVRTYDGTRQTTRIYATAWTGTAWATEQAANVGAFVDAMAVGDVEGDGLDELWIAAGLGVGRVDRTPDFWFTEHAASLPENAFGIAVGDADRDGDDEAWATTGLDDHTGLWRIEATASGYAAEQVARSTAGGARDVVVGDGDNDGRPEAYVMEGAGGSTIQVLRFSHQNPGWAERRIDLGPGKPLGLDLADADGDGRRELYVSDWDGRLLQASWTGSAWVGAAVAQLGSGDFLQEAAVGDADGDGRPEVYGFSVDHTASPGTCCNPVTMVRIAKGAGPQAFDATFTGVRGNEWWQQANVAAAGGTLAKVEVRLGEGAWQPLAKQSWGGWAASYRAPDGTILQFRATSTTGATDLSACYRWIPPSGADAQQVACAGTPPPSGFDATFSNVKGNEWWVQVQAAPNAGHTVTAVQARVDGGAWFSLQKQGWGPHDYAVSRHIPNGSTVQFQAFDAAGASDLSGCYRWIPPSGGLAASVAC